MTSLQRTSSRHAPTTSSTKATKAPKTPTTKPSSPKPSSRSADAMEGPPANRGGQPSKAEIAKARLETLDAFFAKYEGHGKAMFLSRAIPALNDSRSGFPAAAFDDPKFRAKVAEGLRKFGTNPLELYALTEKGHPARDKLAKLICDEKKPKGGRDPRIDFAREVARAGDATTFATMVNTLRTTDKKVLPELTQLYLDFGAASPGGQQAITDAAKLKANTPEALAKGGDSSPLAEMAARAAKDPDYAAVFAAVGKSALSPKAVGELMFAVLEDDGARNGRDQNGVGMTAATADVQRRTLVRSLSEE